MEEYTRQIVTVECFEDVADLRALSPEEYQLFAARVGLKLGQSRKLQKRLGMQVDTGVGGMSPGARSAGAADSSADSSAGAMIGISSNKDTKTSAAPYGLLPYSRHLFAPLRTFLYFCAHSVCPMSG